MWQRGVIAERIERVRLHLMVGERCNCRERDRERPIFIVLFIYFLIKNFIPRKVYGSTNDGYHKFSPIPFSLNFILYILMQLNFIYFC